MSTRDESALVEPADDRKSVRRHRTQAGGALGEFVLAQRRHHRARIVEEFAHTGDGGGGVATVLVLGGADDHAVMPGHEVHLTAVYARADHALRHRHTSAAPPQPKHLALHRTDWQAGPQRRRVDAVRDHHRVRTSLRQFADLWRPLHPEALTVGRECVDDRSIVHRQFGFGAEAVPDALCEQRLEIAHSRSGRHRIALRGQPFGDGLQVGGVGPIDGDHEGLPRGHDTLGKAIQE